MSGLEEAEVLAAKDLEDLQRRLEAKIETEAWDGYAALTEARTSSAMSRDRRACASRAAPRDLRALPCTRWQWGPHAKRHQCLPARGPAPGRARAGLSPRSSPISVL